MYCNLDNSQRKVATFRVWDKRPGYPVHRLDEVCRDPSTQWKAGGMGPEVGLQGVSKGNNFKLQFRRESVLCREQSV
jgi:hypothetical protein